MHNNSFIRFSFLLVSAILLSACISSAEIPNTYYYVLDANNESTSSTTSVNKSSERVVKVLSVQVPDYMKQPNLVLKLQDHQIKIANYHFWAEDMRLSMQRVLLKDLNSKHAAISFSQRCNDCDELSIIIDHFYPTEDGEVLLVGSYELRTQSNEFTRTDFHIRTSLDNGGYNEAVAKMRVSLSRLAVEMSF